MDPTIGRTRLREGISFVFSKSGDNRRSLCYDAGMSIEVYTRTGIEIEDCFEFGVYPGGEPYVKYTGPHIQMGAAPKFMVVARIQSMVDLGWFWQTVDILKTIPRAEVVAFLPYFPGARQDRRTMGYGNFVADSPLTVEMYADFVNAMPLEKVFILDPHSDVTPALLNNCVAFTPELAINTGLGNIRTDYDALIAPDAGASKKVRQLADAFGLEVYQAGKLRNTTTGELSGFSINSLLLGDNPTYLIVDDICDGGGTFAGLASEILKIKPDATLDLWVTHGIFSGNARRNLSVFRDVYSCNSYSRGVEVGYQVDIKCYFNQIKELS